jgi:5'-phosphate synthase pdxT subunit
MRIGVLALQGDFAEHLAVLRQLGVEATEVRLPGDLEGIEGLILPGGESTTIGKLAADFQLLAPLREFGKEHAIWGTCAGAILLAQDAQRQQPLLGLMDIVVRRNAFGRQVESFEEDLDIPVIAVSGDGRGGPFHAIFIRAPWIERVGPGVQILARLSEGTVVAARQKHWLASSFHPELTKDDRFHRYFLQLVAAGG